MTCFQNSLPSHSLTLFWNNGVYSTLAPETCRQRFVFVAIRMDIFCIPEENWHLDLCKIARTISKLFGQEKSRMSLGSIRPWPGSIRPQQENKRKIKRKIKPKILIMFYFYVKILFFWMDFFYITLFRFFFFPSFFQNCALGTIGPHNSVNVSFS